MDEGPEESPKKELSQSGSGINQFEIDAVVAPRFSSRALLESCESRKMSTSSEGELSMKAMLSDWMTSFYEARPVRCEYDDEDDDVELELGQFSSFPKRRTFSQCDSPIDPLPECKIYDSEADNAEEMGSMDHEDDMKKFMLESAACSKIRRRLKPMRVQREIKSDGVVANMMSHTSATEISTRLSRLLLKRSLSAPPTSDFEVRQKRSARIRRFFNRLVKSASKSTQSDTNSPRVSSFKTKPSSEKTDEISECTSTSAETPKSVIACSLEKSESCLVVAGELESSEQSSDSICTPSSQDTDESPLESSESICSSKVSCSTYCGPSKYPTGSSSTFEISSSDTSEISRVSTFPSQYTDDTTLKTLLTSTRSRHPTQTCSTNSSQQKSASELTSESPTVSNVAKVPKKLQDPITPELFDLPGPSKTDGDNAAVSSGGSNKRPTDFNVRPRSAFYSFCATSPTGLMLRPYRSLPNVHRPPVKNNERRSIGLENRRRVVRSLFTGNFSYRGYTPRSNTSSVSKEIIAALQRRPSGSNSEERPSQSKKYVQKDKASVCKKLVFTSLINETNANQTLQDHSSSELIGDVTSLNLNDPSTSEEPKEEPTPKRKEASPIPTGKIGTSVKKPRSLFEFNVQEINVQLTEFEQEAKDEESTNILKPPCDRSTIQRTSPKRKAGDSKVPIAEDRSPETVSKRTKIEPSTPVDEIDISENLHEREKETKPKE